MKGHSWEVPKRADREATYEHLNQIVPDDIKFALHVLLVQHGKEYKNDIRYCKLLAYGRRIQGPFLQGE